MWVIGFPVSFPLRVGVVRSKEETNTVKNVLIINILQYVGSVIFRFIF